MTISTRIEEKFCLQCGDAFSKKTGDSAGRFEKRKHCSKACYTEWQKGKPPNNGGFKKGNQIYKTVKRILAPYTEVSYNAIHKYLGNHYPKTGICDFCSKEKKTQYALKRGREYTRNREDYFELCAACHVPYDRTEEVVAERRARLAGILQTKKGKIVLSNNDGEQMEHESAAAAARHFGFKYGSVQAAAYRGRTVKKILCAYKSALRS